MLASLLPGLREIRTPLAVGYLWLIDIWLIFADKLPPADNEVVRRIFELGELLGKGAIVVAVSFAAYLMGSIIELPVPGFRRNFAVLPSQQEQAQFVDDRRRSYWLVWLMPPRFWLTLLRRSVAPPSFINASRELYFKQHNFPSEHGGAPTRFDLWATINAVVANRDDLQTRLLVADRELYGEYDRLTAESEFRVNVTWPAFVLLIIMALEWGFLVLFGLPFLFVFFWQGLTRDLEALAVLIRAVLVRKIAPDYLMEE
jgi:hypothetical protein